MPLLWRNTNVGKVVRKLNEHPRSRTGEALRSLQQGDAGEASRHELPGEDRFQHRG